MGYGLRQQYGRTDYASGRSPTSRHYTGNATTPAPTRTMSMGSLEEQGIQPVGSTEMLERTPSGTELTGPEYKGSTGGGGEGLSPEAQSGLIKVGGKIIEGVQKAEAARREAVLKDIMRMRSASVEASRNTQQMQDRALSAIDSVYQRYTA